MKRDLRDPQKLGLLYLEARKGGVSIDLASRMPCENYSSNESCVEKYGRPQDIVPLWETIRIR